MAKYVGPDPVQNPAGPDNPANFVPAAPAHQHVDHVDWVGDYWLTPRPPRG